MAGPRVAPGLFGGVVLRPLFLGGRKAMPGDPIGRLEAEDMPARNRRALEASGKVRWFAEPAAPTAPVRRPRRKEEG